MHTREQTASTRYPLHNCCTACSQLLWELGDYHGSLAGWSLHLWENSDPCPDCVEWRGAYPYRLDYRPTHGDSGNGYHWHRYARVPICIECRTSNREYHRNLEASK